MPSYIFVVDQESFRTCVERGVCGCPLHENPRINARAIADLAAIRKGDRVGFYVKKEGSIYGYFRANSSAFYDDTPIWKNPNEVFPYRVLIDDADLTFERPIALTDLYDLADKDVLWSWRRIVQRDCHPFTDLETLEIIRLLNRSNPGPNRTRKVTKHYTPASQKPLPIDLRADRSGKIVSKGGPEAFLMAWLLRELSEGKQREVFGNYTDYVSFVPTSYAKEMDILLLHETPEPHRVLASCTIVELKAGRCEVEDLVQTIRYEDWLIKKCSGDAAMVRSVIVAHAFDPEVISYVHKRTQIEGKPVRLVKYKASGGSVAIREISPGGLFEVEVSDVGRLDRD